MRLLSKKKDYNYNQKGETYPKGFSVQFSRAEREMWMISIGKWTTKRQVSIGFCLGGET